MSKPANNIFQIFFIFFLAYNEMFFFALAYSADQSLIMLWNFFLFTCFNSISSFHLIQDDKAIMATKDIEFFAKQCRYLYTMAEGISDDEKRFSFVRTHILSLDECMQDGSEKAKLLKSMVTWGVKQFGSKEKFKSDVRMLDLWRLLGKYSEEMKMEGVIENVHRLGFFKACPEFYLLWAEHWATQNNRRNFDKTVHLCEENCCISAFECREMFTPLVRKYFDSNAADTSNTIALIKMMATKPDDVRPDLTLFNDPTTKFTTLENTNVKKNHHTTQPKVQAQEPTFVINREEFSVFPDPTVNIVQQQQQPPSQQILQQELNPPNQQMKPSSSALPIVEVNHPTTKNDRRISTAFSDFDDTVSGSHGKFASSMFTSTPRRSIALGAFDPIFDTNQSKLFMADLLADGDNMKKLNIVSTIEEVEEADTGT